MSWFFVTIPFMGNLTTFGNFQLIVSWHVGPCSLGHMPTPKSENEAVTLSLLHCGSYSLINIFYFLLFSYVLGAASNCWLALMDRLLTGDVPKSERQAIKKKMLDLVDIYYLALDAPKEGNKVSFNPGFIIRRWTHSHVVFRCENRLTEENERNICLTETI